MSFEDFAATFSRTFAQTPIRLIRMSSSLSLFAGCLDPPYRHMVLSCQPHFTDKSVSIAFYLNGTAYFEHLNEEKIRQRLQLLNNPRKKSYHRNELEPVLSRLKSLLTLDLPKKEDEENSLHAKLLSSRLLSIELVQGDLNFKFRCEERPEIFEQHYVRQLLLQVKELSQRQTYLCELLEHKDELPQFDSKLFLNTPMTLVDDEEEENEDGDILSSSAIGRLWKAAFARRGGQNFLDICLLKKAYLKALEGVGAEQSETVDDSATFNTMDDQFTADEDSRTNDGDDNMDLAARVMKRSMTSNANAESDQHETKRSRNNPVTS